MSNKLETQFEKTVSGFQRQAFIDVVRQKPNTTIEDLYMLGKKHELTDLTLAELMGKHQPKAIRKTKKQAAGTENDIDVRTAAGRAAYDEAVFEVIKNADGEYVSAQQVRKAVGGKPHQARKALNRLIDAGQISFKGKARATRYTAVQ